MSTVKLWLETPRDLFGKLNRDAVLLDEEVTGDRFFNFVVTGYSLIDWVKNGVLLPESDVKSMRDDTWIKVCGDLATAAKHYTLTSRQPITSSADSKQGYGLGRYDKGDYSKGEESIQIELADGRSFSCLELTAGVVKAWEEFFSLHGL